MAKLGRATAGRQVQALALAFDADLLDDEETAFAAMDRAFLAQVPTASKAVSAAVGRRGGDVAGVRNDTAVLDQVVKMHRAAVTACLVPVRGLAGVATDKGLAAIAAELEVCERTLPARYVDVARLAVKAGGTVKDDVIGRVGAAYLVAAQGASADIRAELVQQLAAAKDRDELLLRIFSPEPLGLRGFAGRGVWWRSVSDLKSAAREVATQGSNMIRLSTMWAFNEVARGR